MIIDFIITYQGYLYFLLTVLLTLGLYLYIFHLYWSEKTGRRNYEKYANIALNDEIDDTPVEPVPGRDVNASEQRRAKK